MATKTEEISPGIVRRGEHIFWTHAKIVRPYVEKFLINQFPNSYIEHEVNDIDIIVSGENLPVEIQSTPATKWGVGTSSFEKNIQKQIKENIETYERCWFFFDSEFLKHLQNPDIHRKTSMSMDWFRKYMKENVLKVFTVRYDGIIKEINYKDLDFLSNISTTCDVGYDNDLRILNRNKIRIYDGVCRGYKFTQNEISKFHYDFIKSGLKGDFKKYLYKHENARARLYARILHGIAGYLEAVNCILDLHVEDVDMQHEKYYISVFGLFNMEKRSRGSLATFLDKFDIAKYFPGYMRNVETWNTLKGKCIDGKRLDNILKRKYDVSRGVDFYWNR